VCQVDDRRWITVQAHAAARTDTVSPAQTERRYAEHYRPPRPNPERVVIKITVTRTLSNL
jgi:hypothetical protein